MNEHCQTRQIVSEMKDILPTAVFNSFKADFSSKLSNLLQVPLLKTEPRMNPETRVRQRTANLPYNRQETGGTLDPERFYLS